jgi:hypothetical protein
MARRFSPSARSDVRGVEAIVLFGPGADPNMVITDRSERTWRVCNRCAGQVRKFPSPALIIAAGVVPCLVQPVELENG